MSLSLENVLISDGPMLSSVLVNKLVGNGVNREAARQRISRAGGKVKRLKGVNFPNREAFLFVEGQFASDLFNERLEDAFEKTRSAYGRAIRGLKSREGVMLASQFPIATGAPIDNAVGHLRHSRILDKLRELSLVKVASTSDGKDLVTLWNSPEMSAHRSAVFMVEEILLSALRTWFIKVGWSSEKTLAVRTEKQVPQVGQFAFDVVGPCYLAALRSSRSDGILHGFLAGDIILGKTLNELDLWPFFCKLEVLEAQKRKHRFQPIFIGESFTSEVLMKLRKRGVLIVLPSVFFGEDAAKDLRDLVDVIENAAAAVAKDPAYVFELLKRLSKIEGAALNLRGIVLEMMMAHIYKINGYNIDIRKLVRTKKDGLAEVDVRAQKGREVVCLECKGKSAGTLVNSAEIREWLNDSLPVIKKWLKEQPDCPETRRFEFYSSTDYSQDAKKLILEIEATHKAEPIKFYKGDEIIHMLQGLNLKSLVNIFREQFLK